MKKLLDEKASWEQKILDAQSQRDSIKRQYDSSKGEYSQARERIIQDWQNSQADKDFAVDMRLVGAEVTTKVTLGKLREALGERTPQSTGAWSRRSTTRS